MSVYSNNRRLTAIHEAAHAVTHLRLHQHIYIGTVTIVATDGLDGRAQFERVDSGSADDWRNEVVVLCAGYASQLLAGDNEDDARIGASSDLEQAAEIISRWNLSPLADHVSAATQLLEQSCNRKAIERIAAELLKQETLPGDEVEMLLAIADGEASEADYEQYLLLRN